MCTPPGVVSIVI